MSAPTSPVEDLAEIVGEELARKIDAMMSGVIRPLLTSSAPMPPHPNGRRFCVLHLDGVSRDLLFAAMREGRAPFMRRLVESRAYALSPTFSGAPASTPAFQAGLLYGARDADIPGFIWFDRKTRREVRMDRRLDAAAVEARLRKDHRSLFQGGSVNYAIFSGGAKVNGFTMAGWAEERTQILSSRKGRDLAASVAAHSVTATRIAVRLALEGAEALFDLFRQSARVGRYQHEGTFLWHRVGVSIGAREHGTWGTLLDIARGIPSIYTCYSDYDEIAHRRGPEGASALRALEELDRSIACVFAAVGATPELRYDLYVLSDHGQVATHPFEQVTGMTLGDYLAFAEPAGRGAPIVPPEAARRMNRYRRWDRLAQALPRRMQAAVRQVGREVARALLESRTDADCLRLLDEVVCIEAGDIAHLYLGGEERPLTLAAIEERFGRLLNVVTCCPSVGIVAARGGRAGYAFFFGRKIDLADPETSGALSLGYGGRQTAELLAKMLSLPSAGDLVVYGNGLPRHSVAFAWEFGSHGGVAREEVETFVIHPRRVRFDLASINGGADLHDFLASEYGVGERTRERVAPLAPPDR